MTTRQHPAEAARRLLDEGVEASRANESERALSLFALAASEAPGWALPHFLIASEHASAGEWEKAEAEFANTVLLDPGLHIARYQLGLLQFSSGRAALALVSWQPLFDQPRDDGLADFVRGFAALAHDDFAAARDAFEQGLTRAEVNPAVAGDIQKVLAQLPASGRASTTITTPATDALSHVLVANYDRFKLH